MDEALRRYLRERADLLARGAPGLGSAQQLASMTDGVVAELAAAASSHVRGSYAVMAAGGFGAGRLLPQSDIDLLIVARSGRVRVEELVRGIAYPLWDSGLKASQQVRTAGEHLRMCRDDTTVLTATLAARHLAGDHALSQRVIAQAFELAHRTRSKLATAFAQRVRKGSPYLLEVDLKEGAGGQRDLDEIYWMACAHLGRSPASPVDIAGAGLLTAREASLLGVAQDSIAHGRWALHTSGTRPVDFLSRESAEDPGIDATRVQRALIDVHHVLFAARERFVSGTTAKEDDPSTAHTTYWNVERLMRALPWGDESLPDVERAAWNGELQRLMPGIRELMAVRRPGLSHRYTVGAHCLRCATAIAAVDEADPLANSAIDAIGDPRPLVVAALTHDFGKATLGPGHASRALEVTRLLARRFELDSQGEEDAARLVSEHLLLSETATMEDVTDDDVVRRAAERLGSQRILASLYLLTKADCIATGPGVWTPWLAKLVGDLTSKLDAVLSPESEGPSMARGAIATRSQALSSASKVGAEASVLSFLEQVPKRYLAERDPREVLRHADLAAQLRGPSGPSLVLDVSAESPHDTWRVTVISRDRPGLLAMMTGVLSLSGLEILEAEAFSQTLGVAIDVFVVSSASLAPVEHDKWALVERRMRAVVDGRFDLEARMREWRRHAPPPKRMIEPSVAFDTGNPALTAIRVRSADRTGLLHDYAQALHALGVDIRLVRAHTADGLATDIFHVVDGQGQPYSRKQDLDRIGAALRNAAGWPA